MLLEGSCHCGAVRFSVSSAHPYPFNLCYCSICRKTAGSGGYAINLSADYETLAVEGQDNITVYRAKVHDDATGEIFQSRCERSFCGQCGSALWVWSSEWPELLHPFASALDTPLPKPLERTHLMAASKAPWVEVRTDPRDKTFDGYPDESIAQWHQRLGVEDRD